MFADLDAIVGPLFGIEERTVASGWTFTEGGAYLEDARELTEEKRRCWADVAVLAHHEGTDIAEGWSFYVLPAATLNERSAKSISVSAARKLIEPVGTEGLAAAVQRAAHEEEGGYRASRHASPAAAPGGYSYPTDS